MLQRQCRLLGFDLKKKLNIVMMDSEWSMMKAIKAQFKTCQILGCRFHLGQSWWRKIKEVGLSKEYKSVNSKTGQWLRGVFGLALLSPELVTKVFKSYVKILKNPDDKVQKFIDYLSEYYMVSTAQFPPQMWAGIKGKTTNNGAEAFHRAFGDLFGYLRSKPNIGHFLRNMKRFNFWKQSTINTAEAETNIVEVSAPTQAQLDADQQIKLYKCRKIRVTTLLKKLSLKNQPKTRPLTQKRRKTSLRRI